MANKLLTLTLLFSLFLSGCLSPTAVASTPTSTVLVEPQVTNTAPQPTLTGTPSPAPATAAPTSPTFACNQPGTIETNNVPNNDFGRDLPYRIYLPPCYQDIETGLPTLFLLHGLAGDDQTWLQLGIASEADRLIQAGEIPAILIVFPWQRAGLEDEAAIVEGLLPHVEGNYRTLPGGRYRAIGGLSRGGGWALRLGLKHPQDFTRVGLHSPAPRSGDLTSMAVWAEDNQSGRKPSIWIDIGDQDSLLPAAEQIAQRLEDLNYEYQLSIREGEHLAAYWRRNLEDYLRWYTANW